MWARLCIHLYCSLNTKHSICLVLTIARATLLSPFASLQVWGKERRDEAREWRKESWKEIRGKAAIPHCDFTLGWLEQSVEGLASSSLQTHIGRRGIKKENLMKWDIHSEKPFQTVSPHPLHGNTGKICHGTISNSYSLYLTRYNHILAVLHNIHLCFSYFHHYKTMFQADLKVFISVTVLLWNHGVV